MDSKTKTFVQGLRLASLVVCDENHIASSALQATQFPALVLSDHPSLVLEGSLVEGTF